MLSDTSYLMLALILFGPLFYKPREEKHANPKARKSAQQQYEKAKKEFEHWDKKPNKTPEEKKLVKKLRNLVEHLRKKKDFTGENHSQKNKGN